MTENSPKRDLAVATRAIPLLRSDFEVSTAAAILLKQWMARKGVESANRLKAAIAENYRLQALVAQEELNLIETEELFKHLDSIKEMVSFKVQADVEEQKERLNRLKRDNDLADELSQNAKLKVKAEREEIRADTLQASVRIMQLEEKLTSWILKFEKQKSFEKSIIFMIKNTNRIMRIVHNNAVNSVCQ